MNKECLTCKKSFYVSPSRSHIKNCSYICNKVWRKTNSVRFKPLCNCLCGCGSTVKSHRAKYVFGHSPQMRKGQTNSGSYIKGHKGLSGVNAPNWKGGMSLMRNGYLQIRLNGKRKYLHRIVAEQTIGRELKVTEQVHHIDHDKLNNSPDNLVVLSPAQHARYHSNVMWGNLTKGEYHGV